MQERHLFEYAVLRVMPHVEREEFINVGVILYCAQQKYLKSIFHLDEKRFEVFCGTVDAEDICEHLKAFERICIGGKHGGPIGLLDIASRFRWLTATRSTVVQTSKVHPGFCRDAEEKLHSLYQQLVLLP